MIAENFLTDVECFNQTRGMLGYTGNYQGKRVSVMGHGMGIPSIGIYTYELFSFYDVENIIRIGSIGGLDTSLNLGDVIIAQGALHGTATMPASTVFPELLLPSATTVF